MGKIFAFDFDGTLANTEYPKIISPRLDIIEYAKACKKFGNTIILNTCRHDAELDDAVEFCRSYGLEFDYINENLPELIEKYGDCRKIYADVYIDDKAVPVSSVEVLNKRGD